MHVLHASRRLICNIFVFFLLTSILATAFLFNPFFNALFSRFFDRRSLPGSLAWAPPEAVGHQAPAGPITQAPPLTQAAIVTPSSVREIIHGLKRAAATTKSQSQMTLSGTVIAGTAVSSTSSAGVASERAALNVLSILVPVLMVTVQL